MTWELRLSACIFLAALLLGIAMQCSADTFADQCPGSAPVWIKQRWDTWGKVKGELKIVKSEDRIWFYCMPKPIYRRS